MGETYSFDPNQTELAFMSATRSDSKTNRSMCRGEFMDFILRLAHIQFRKIQGKILREISIKQDINLMVKTTHVNIQIKKGMN